jgi:hypothetical protein
MAYPKRKAREERSLVVIEAELENHAPRTIRGRQVSLRASGQARPIPTGVFAGFQPARRDAAPVEYSNGISHDQATLWGAVVGVLREHRQVELDAKRRVLRG